MARHKQPEDLAKLKGADKKNPQRYLKDSAVNKNPVGEAPDHMTGGAKAVWDELKSMALPGVLTLSDRILLEMLSNLIYEYRSSPEEFPVGKHQHMIGTLARFGMSPADRQKLSGGDGKKKSDNEFDDF